MTVFIPSVHDVEASIDVLTDVTELSDSLDVDRALAFRDAAAKVLEAARKCVGALDDQLVQVLEAPTTRGDFIYEVKPKADKIRFDHAKIAAGVIDAVQADVFDPETGELTAGVREIAEKVTDAMRAIYVNDSMEAKVGGLKSYGIERDAVRSVEWAGKRVKVTPVAVAERQT